MKPVKLCLLISFFKGQKYNPIFVKQKFVSAFFDEKSLDILVKKLNKGEKGGSKKRNSIDVFIASIYSEFPAGEIPSFAKIDTIIPGIFF